MMAIKSAVFSGFPYASNQSLTLEFWIESQDLLLNRTTFGYKATIGGSGNTNAGSYTFSGAMSASVSGQTWTWPLVIAQGTFNVDHNSDGTLAPQTLNLTVSVFANGATGSASLSVSEAVPTIPRSSSITNFNNFLIDASTIPVEVARAVSSFYHRAHLQVWNGSAWQTIKSSSNFDTSVDMALTEAQQNTIYALIPNALSIPIRIGVDTYNTGESYIGSSFKEAVASVPPSVVPTITDLTFYDTVAASRATGVFIQNISKIEMTMTGLAGEKSSTVASTEIHMNSEPAKTTNPATTTNPIKYSGPNVTMRGIVIDSRGRRGERVEVVPVIPYAPPSITEIIVGRANSDGSPNPVGINAKITVKGRWSSISVGGTEKNSGSLVVKTGPRGGTLTTRATSTVGATFEEVFVLSGFVIENEYDVQAEITDLFYTQAGKAIVKTGKAPFVIGREGIGSGKIPNQVYSYDAAGAINSDTDIMVGGNSLMPLLQSAPNGYVKFPGGLILQWGSVSVPASSGQVGITFPTSFTTAIYGLFPAVQTSGAYIITMGNLSLSGGTIFLKNHDGGVLSNAQTVKWFAIGV